jgi:hypothetical protein
VPIPWYRKTVREKGGYSMMQRDDTVQSVLERLEDLEKFPDESLVPYKEFEIDEKTYYFTPGGFLYRKDPDTEALGGFFCGYLTDEVWHYRTDDS